jgi:hypothetical protein
MLGQSERERQAKTLRLDASSFCGYCILWEGGNVRASTIAFEALKESNTDWMAKVTGKK